jgi:hypothetical protein
VSEVGTQAVYLNKVGKGSTQKNNANSRFSFSEVGKIHQFGQAEFVDLHQVCAIFCVAQNFHFS